MLNDHGPPQQRVDKFSVFRVAFHQARRNADDAALLDQVQRPHLLEVVQRVHRRPPGIARQQHLHSRVHIRLALHDDGVDVLRQRRLDCPLKTRRDP